MEQLISKLSSLSYEILGIILPGAITLILFILWLTGAGELLPIVSQGFFPRLTLQHASETLESLGVRTGVGILGPTLLIAYFLGHLLHWISRSGVVNSAVVENAIERTWHAMTFRVAKPSNSYNIQLQPLLDNALPRFGLPTGAGWRQFYPVAKSYLARSSTSSLVALYQNKYTLHRSITAGAALIFWLSLSSSCSDSTRNSPSTQNQDGSQLAHLCAAASRLSGDSLQVTRTTGKCSATPLLPRHSLCLIRRT